MIHRQQQEGLNFDDELNVMIHQQQYIQPTATAAAAALLLYVAGQGARQTAIIVAVLSMYVHAKTIYRLKYMPGMDQVFIIMYVYCCCMMGRWLCLRSTLFIIIICSRRQQASIYMQ